MTDKLEDVLLEYDGVFDDFGFTEVSEEEFQKSIDEAITETKTEVEAETSQEYEEKIENLKSLHAQKMKDVEKLILPFLIKLMKAKEVYIKWPHEVREPVIKDQIQKILAVTRD